MTETEPEPTPSRGDPPSRSGAFAGLAWRHRALLARLLGLILVLTFVLQNSEPTTIDFLFWSLPSAPKLLLIVTGMVLGAIVWEISRRLLGSPRKR